MRALDSEACPVKLSLGCSVVLDAHGGKGERGDATRIAGLARFAPVPKKHEISLAVMDLYLRTDAESRL